MHRERLPPNNRHDATDERGCTHQQRHRGDDDERRDDKRLEPFDGSISQHAVELAWNQTSVVNRKLLYNTKETSQGMKESENTRYTTL